MAQSCAFDTWNELLNDRNYRYTRLAVTIKVCEQSRQPAEVKAIGASQAVWGTEVNH